MSVYPENTQIDGKVVKLQSYSGFDRFIFLFVISALDTLAMFWRCKGKTIGYPLVKTVLKNKTGHSQGHIFIVTSKVYGLLWRVLYFTPSQLKEK